MADKKKFHTVETVFLYILRFKNAWNMKIDLSNVCYIFVYFFPRYIGKVITVVVVGGGDIGSYLMYMLR